jgi:hypothetical protein
MVRSLMLAMVIVVGVCAPAVADIRIDPDDPLWTPRRPTPSPGPRPTPLPPPPTEPIPQPRPEPRGCAGRDMGPEWLFGASVLACGLAGMRRYRARSAAA